MELRQLPPQFLEEFRKRIGLMESMLPGFQVFGVDVTGSDLGGQNSPLANQILVQARSLELSGCRGDELQREACAGALAVTVNAQRRLIEQHILTAGSDLDSKATVGASRAAIRSVKILPIVDAFLPGFAGIAACPATNRS